MPNHDKRYFNKKSGLESFVNHEDTSKFNLLEFWRWSYSNIMFNTIRGDLGEYIIFKAIEDALDKDFYIIRRDGDVCDFQIGDIWIEVKTASYIQAWDQKEPSKILFDIAEREDYNFEKEARIKGSKKRWANVYVFCLLKEKDRDKVDPLDIDQWDFWVASTSEIERERGKKKKLSIHQMPRVNPIKCKHHELLEAIHSTYDKYKDIQINCSKSE